MKILLITNDKCYSACVWFVKLFANMPNVIHLG